MFEPAFTVAGLATSVMDTSPGDTVTLLLAVSLAATRSVVVLELTVTDPAIEVFPAVVETSVTTSVKFAVPPLASAPPSVHVTVPELPTAGVTQLQPAGLVTEVKVASPAGIVCTHLGTAAPLGPLFVTTMV
jgi:hypothetical protein